MTPSTLVPDLFGVDVGNSKVAAALFVSGSERARWRLEFDRLDDAAWLKCWSAALAAACDVGATSAAAVVASVAPARSGVLVPRLRRAGFAHVHVASANDPWPFALDVEEPHSVGIDRLVNVAGLCALGARSGVVVDAGSAITLDVLRDGRFVGGLILPGLSMAARALHEQTQQLPRFSLNAMPPLVGRHTRAALQAGVHHGTTRAVQQLVRELRRTLGARARVLYTGGCGESFAPSGHREVAYDPQLWMRGLRCLAARL